MRRPSTQDISWLLDLERNKQLNLSPSYQRRSVWTNKDKQYFLDTIFRNYPSPALFLHKTIDDSGKATYHVVDGKQRIETILKFADNKVRLGSDFGDNRLDGMRWSKIEQGLRQDFWNYQITVEMIDVIEVSIVNEVFDRLNRNSRKLTRQEMRHARFDGWFIQLAESEAENDTWIELKIATKARAKRMADVQFLSELLLTLMHGKVTGFDQDAIDEICAEFDDLDEITGGFLEDEFRNKLLRLKVFLSELERSENLVTTYGKSLTHFYSLWAYLCLQEELPVISEFATKYHLFMQKVFKIQGEENFLLSLADEDKDEYSHALSYSDNSRGASTEAPQRLARHDAMIAEILEP